MPCKKCNVKNASPIVHASVHKCALFGMQALDALK